MKTVWQPYPRPISFATHKSSDFPVDLPNSKTSICLEFMRINPSELEVLKKPIQRKWISL